jgi:3-methyladenine DNA glycosylase AlkC
MAEEIKLFKDLYSPVFVNSYAALVKQFVPSFDTKKFVKAVFDTAWKDKELKQRMRHISDMLHAMLPGKFPEHAEILVKMVDAVQKGGSQENTFTYLCIPDYIEVYGLEHYTASVKAIERITQFISCEFAVRPFILKHGDRMLQQMIKWGNHKSEKVRRLASEGCRPRLPWAVALPALKKDPSPILPLLEKLKDDKAEWVRRSVANNFNDISKDNPEVVLALFKKWHGKSKETDWVIKHGSRTLLKQGHTELLGLFGFDQDGSAALTNMQVLTSKVKWDSDLMFSFTIQNTSNAIKKIRLEYGMYYMKANGSLSKKVFKISEREYAPGEVCNVVRKQSFRPITTRVYHAGAHKVAVIINGHEKTIADFVLEKKK